MWSFRQMYVVLNMIAFIIENFSIFILDPLKIYLKKS